MDNTSDKNLRLEYLRLLEPWIKSAAGYIFSCGNDRPDLRYYGDGTNGWGVQTNQKALSAFAVLSVDPDLDEDATGMTRDELLDNALSMLRYSMESHKSGSYHTTDADDFKWGHTWISALGIERMMHAVGALDKYLTGNDRDLLRRMLISESDWLLEEYDVKAGLIKSNVPESNMWNGCILARTALKYPDAPNSDTYKAKATRFFANSVSIPSDKYSNLIFDGKPLSELHTGANFFESYSCNHHGYMNVGYMVITLSNLAMLHFTCRHLGLEPPACMYLHFEKLWQLVRMCIFEDGRLMRIGGDSRVRYCYCQDYLLPVLMLVSDSLGEDCSGMERGWIKQVAAETAYNADNSYLSKRCELLVEKSPLYYTRLESDRAVSLSYGIYWRRIFNGFRTNDTYATNDANATATITTAVTAAATTTTAANADSNNSKIADSFRCGSYIPDLSFRNRLTQWYDEYHGSCYVRGRNRMASFTWLASEPPQGMCVPASDSSLAEWQHNMTSSINGDGFSDTTRIITHNEHIYEGGFATAGCYITRTEGLVAEQIRDEDTVINHIAYAALPDDSTIVTMQYATAVKRVHLSKVKAFRLNIPNDIFNGFKRDYERDGSGRLIIIDGKISVIAIYGGALEIYHPGYRQIGLRSNWPYHDRGMLCCDEICTKLALKPEWYEKGATVFDFAAAVNIAGVANLSVYCSVLHPEGRCGRAISIRCADSRLYLFAANFADTPEKYSIEVNGRAVEIELAAYDAILTELT